MAETRAPAARPLSPHIHIYKFMLTYVMSGFHRVTGIVLYFGIVLVVWWLLAAASGPNAYAWVQWFYGSWIGRLVIVGFIWGLIHHSLGGVRHLIWDTLHGFGPNEREWLARATLAGSISLTVIFVIAAYLVMGGGR
jgi:succinate dehydrogenase / fumarate reductase, cytochrome b subunit